MHAPNPSPARSTNWLLRGGDVLTLDAEGSVLPGTDLLFRDGRIVGIGRDLDAPEAQVLEVAGSLVLPGLIQGHVHLGQTLMRGLAEGRRLLPWLSECIWPLEAVQDEGLAEVAAAWGAAECLLAGTTTVQDIGIGPGFAGLVAGIEASGLRAVLGPCLMDQGRDLPAALRGDTGDVLAAAESWGRELAMRPGGLLRPALCPRFILSCSDALWQGVGELARRYDWPIHTHALEQPEETAAVRRAKGGRDEIAYFGDLGALDLPLRLAHGVGLEAAHLARLRDRPVGIVHCPGSNLKLGSGVADVPAIRAAGIAVGVGCDGAACNNGLDALEELRLAARLQILRRGPEAVRGLDVLRLATSEGARVLGLDDEIGSLRVGLRADVLVLGGGGRPGLWNGRPGDPHDAVIYTATRGDVRHVFVDGRPRVLDHGLVGADLGVLAVQVATAVEELQRRRHELGPAAGAV